MAENQATADNESKTEVTSAEATTQNQGASSDFESRLNAARTPDELAKLQREFFETDGNRPKASDAEAEAQATDENGEDASRQDSGADADADANGSEGGLEAEEGDTQNSAGDSDGDGEAAAKEEGEEASSEKGTQFRIRRKDPVEKRALELVKRNPDLSLEDAISRAKKEVLGDKPETPKENAPEVDATLPQSLDEAQAKLKELRAAKSKALREELDLAKADDLDLEMDRIREHLSVLKRKTVEEQTRAEQTYLQEFNASQQKASGLYQFLSDENSAGFARAREIDEQLSENSDPLFHHPNKPLIIAQMVAAELRIAPKSATKVAAKSPQSAPAGRNPAASSQSKPGSVISSGGSRTVTQSTQSGQQAAKIDSVQTLDDLRALGVAVD